MTKSKELLDEAILYASVAHKGQKRKGKNVAYISHPINVMKIVKERGYGIEAQIACVLHDVIEDCQGYTLEGVSLKFGTAIALLVDYVTEEDKSLPWMTRKVAYIDRLKDAPYDAVVVSAGDKLHNLRDTYDDFRDNGESTFKMFNSSTDHQFWFYESLIEIYKKQGLFDFTDEMEYILGDIKTELV